MKVTVSVVLQCNLNHLITPKIITPVKIYIAYYEFVIAHFVIARPSQIQRGNAS